MTDPSLRKDLLKLVRYLLGGCATLKATADAAQAVTLTRADGAALAMPAALLDRTLALGLTVRTGDRVEASADARAFLRRALAAPDEAFADQHRVIAGASVGTGARRQRVRINLAESPLSSLARLKEKSGAAFLPEDAIAAGERLHADFTRAQLQPRLTMAYEPRLSTRTKGSAGGSIEVSDSAMAARARVASAMEAIGPELCGVALDICGFEKGLETVERERQWPARSAKLMLRAALMALARHYAPPASDGRRRSHAWGAEGYRPELDGGR